MHLNKQLINDVQIHDLVNILDERGSVTEIFTINQGEFFRPTQHCYAARVYAGVTKAWHFHKIQEDAFTCVQGQIKLVLVDTRNDSPTFGVVNQFFLSFENPMTVRIPPGVLHGFKGVEGQGPYAVVINNCTHPYNPKEPDEYRVAPHDLIQQKLDLKQLGILLDVVPYCWERKDY